MAREYAQVNMGIWSDDDFRALPAPAQHLYFMLWTHPQLSYCGVVDWRPGRIAALAEGWTAAAVDLAAQCLEARLFIVVDRESEECLIRSFVRFDGLMKKPRIVVSYANAYAGVASKALRGVIVHEAHKLQDLEPHHVGWNTPRTQALLSGVAVDPRSLTLPTDPFGAGFAYGFAPGFGVGLAQTLATVCLPPTTATATTTAPLLTTPSESESEEPKSKAAAPAPPPLFEDFYQAYPKKRGRAAAVKAFAKAIRTTPPEVIVAGAERYRDDPNLVDRQYIPDPASWLNAGRWDDDPCDPPTGVGAKPLAAPDPLHARLARELAERKARR